MTEESEHRRRLLDVRAHWIHRTLALRLLQAHPDATQEERKVIWEKAWEWARAAAPLRGSCPTELADWLRAWTPTGWEGL